ncbi:MAG: hypothetical protein LKE37_05050 [Atopobiaceae bacterium]|jgi:hypothetical protein|nr:hypothetical protein [Atopobiaceae bacterium]
MDTTSESCRSHFESCGLNYEGLRKDDIWLLQAILARSVRTSDSTTIDDLHISRKVDIKTNDDGSLIGAYIYISGSYFKKREAVSFNEDGFIGFCGWADSNNSRPIYEGFEAWVDQVSGLV